MTTMTITYDGQLHTQITHRQSGTTISTDAPTDNGGSGESFSPTDLLASALGSCMLTIMALKTTDMAVDLSGTSISVEKKMATNPRRVAEVIVDVHFAHQYDSKTKTILEAAAKACPVAQSLHADLKQTINFHHVE